MTLTDKVVELGYTSLPHWRCVKLLSNTTEENSTLVETDGESENHEVEESDENLDEFYDSEFDIAQEKVDDNDFNNNVDPTVEYAGVGEQIHTDLGTNLVYSMLQLKKEDALVNGSSKIEVDIDWVPLNERVDNPPTIGTQEVADSTSAASSSSKNLQDY
nr:uncharacterized protein LOC109165835 [Ipomoea trifida]